MPNTDAAPGGLHPDFARITRTLILTRLATGKTQKQLATELGVATDTVQTWEGRGRIPEPSHFGDWFDTLGMRLVLVPKRVDGMDADQSYSDAVSEAALLRQELRDAEETIRGLVAARAELLAQVDVALLTADMDRQHRLYHDLLAEARSQRNQLDEQIVGLRAELQIARATPAAVPT